MASVFEVANYFLFLANAESQDNEPSGLTNLKIQKLAYYAQGHYLAMFDKPLFDDEIFPWKHGPVVKTLYVKYRKFGYNDIEFDAELKDISLEKQEKTHIEKINKSFGQYTAWKLREMTHDEAPWVNNQEYWNRAIPHEELKEYFLDCFDMAEKEKELKEEIFDLKKIKDGLKNDLADNLLEMAVENGDFDQMAKEALSEFRAGKTTLL